MVHQRKRGVKLPSREYSYKKPGLKYTWIRSHSNRFSQDREESLILVISNRHTQLLSKIVLSSVGCERPIDFPVVVTRLMNYETGDYPCCSCCNSHPFTYHPPWEYWVTSEFMRGSRNKPLDIAIWKIIKTEPRSWTKNRSVAVVGTIASVAADTNPKKIEDAGSITYLNTCYRCWAFKTLPPRFREAETLAS